MEVERSDQIFTRLQGVDYKKAFGILEHASCHPRMAEETFLEHIQPRMSDDHKSTFLDVGCGGGGITRRIAPFFSRGVVVEMNTSMISSSDMPENVDIRLGNFLDVDLSDCSNGFDFILCSHVLYRMPKDILQQMILKIYSLLRPGGQALLVLAAPRNMTHEFLCDLVDEEDIWTSQKLLEVVRDANLSHETIEKSNDMRLSSLDHVRTILEFMLVENSADIIGVLPEHEPAIEKVLHAVATASPCHQVDELSSQEVTIDARLETDSLSFVLTQDDDHIIIRKPSSAATM